MTSRGGATRRTRKAAPRRAQLVPGFRALRRLRRRRLLVPLVVLGVAAFLYAQPLARYAETRGELAGREREVVQLRAKNAELELRLERSTSLVALSREARRVGLVRPGEQLFIVKGIPAWRKSNATVSDDGGP